MDGELDEEQDDEVVLDELFPVPASAVIEFTNCSLLHECSSYCLRVSRGSKQSQDGEEPRAECRMRMAREGAGACTRCHGFHRKPVVVSCQTAVLCKTAMYRRRSRRRCRSLARQQRSRARLKSRARLLSQARQRAGARSTAEHPAPPEPIEAAEPVKAAEPAVAAVAVLPV